MQRRNPHAAQGQTSLEATMITIEGIKFAAQAGTKLTHAINTPLTRQNVHFATAPHNENPRRR